MWPTASPWEWKLKQTHEAPEGAPSMAHTFTNILIHALFSTKHRQPYLDAELRTELFPYMGGIIAKLNGQSLLINGPSDHVHLLFVQPAALGLAELMEKVKAKRKAASRPRMLSGNVMVRCAFQAGAPSAWAASTSRGSTFWIVPRRVSVAIGTM